jgi:plastocyanin
MRKLIVVVLALAGCAGGVLAATALAATKSIKVGDNYYVRPSGVPKVTVSRGTTVKWNFRGASTHTVTVKSGPTHFRSCVRSSGSCKRKLRKRGTYVIYCTIHGRSDMSMRLKVR